MNYEKAPFYLLKACQLDCLDTNRESVKISLSIYGADLFENRTYVSAGIKIMDMREVHPVTNQPLFFINEDINVEKIVKIQSSEICCILVIADARDKKSCTKKYSKNFMNGGKELVQKAFLHPMEILPSDPFL